MVPTLNREIGLRRGSDQEPTEVGTLEVTPPAVQPAALEAPLSAALPRTAAGQMRAARSPRARLQSNRIRVNWMELSTIGLGAACAAASVYRLLWAIH